MSSFLTITLGDLVGSGIAAALVAALLHRRNVQVENEIKAYFDEQLKVFESTRSWKEKALTELFGPMAIQLDRTRRAFERWGSKNLYLEARVVREGNIAVRDMLLANGHLIPPHLIESAGALIEHYDRWLEEFERVRAATNPADDQAFVFVGPAGFPFPREAEEKFNAEYLYGV
jgi:hypothetical protein